MLGSHKIAERLQPETLAALQLAQKEQWHQLFTDGTGRRQVALETILIALENDAGELKPLILSAAHILEGESSEQTCAAVLKQIESGGARLGRWAEVHEHMHPDDAHDIPDVSEMNMTNAANLAQELGHIDMRFSSDSKCIILGLCMRFLP